MLTSHSGILAQVTIYSGPFTLKILACHDENLNLIWWKSRPIMMKISTYNDEKSRSMIMKISTVRNTIFTVCQENKFQLFGRNAVSYQISA